jgi:threonine dehydratase
MIIYLQTFLLRGLDMRVRAPSIRPRVVFFFFISLFLASTLISQGFAAEAQKAEATPPSKESFNLILPFKDLTVGQGQETTMDAEVVNRTKDPVEVSLTIEGTPAGWDINFNSRYPSFPVRSVMVQGGDQN